MDLADGPIALIRPGHIHGQPLILAPNGALPDSDKPQLPSRVTLSTFGVISIIEDVKLVPREIGTQLGDEEFVLGWFLFGRDEVVAADAHRLLLRGKDEGRGRSVIQLVERVFLFLWLAADDDERRIDMIDRDDVSIHESILEKGPDVIVFLVLLQRTCSLWEQSLTHLSQYLQLSLLALATRIELDHWVVRHFFYRSMGQYKDDQWEVCVSIIHIYILREEEMMLRMIMRPLAMKGGLVRNMIAGYRPYGKDKLKPYDDKQKTPQPSPKKMKSMAVYEDQSQLQLAQSIKQLSLKDFSIKVHHLLVGKQKSPIFWATVQQQFMERLQPTTNPHQIRSYSKVLYSLSKSKKATGNYETKLSLILPFATPQSFTTITTAVSRIAPYSQQFGYIIEMLYYKRKTELNPREIIAINYSLANNGRQCDKAIIEHLDSYNAVQTITMLRCYDKSDQMTKEILGKTLKKLLALRNQFNALDISDIICIYLKHQYIPPVLESMLEESYSILKRYINDICIEKIWTHLPSSLNKGYLKVKFVEEIITTIEILRKGKNMSEVIWKKMQPTFQQIENIELRLRLEKIY